MCFVFHSVERIFGTTASFLVRVLPGTAGLVIAVKQHEFKTSWLCKLFVWATFLFAKNKFPISVCHFMRPNFPHAAKVCFSLSLKLVSIYSIQLCLGGKRPLVIISVLILAKQPEALEAVQSMYQPNCWSENSPSRLCGGHDFLQ